MLVLVFLPWIPNLHVQQPLVKRDQLAHMTLLLTSMYCRWGPRMDSGETAQWMLMGTSKPCGTGCCPVQGPGWDPPLQEVPRRLVDHEEKPGTIVVLSNVAAAKAAQQPQVLRRQHPKNLSTSTSQSFMLANSDDNLKQGA